MSRPGIACRLGVTVPIAAALMTVGAALLRAPEARANVAPRAVGQYVRATRGASPLSLDLQAVDADDDPITFLLVSPATHGTAAITPSGQATYTVDARYAGSDTFTFAATDGIDQGDAATVDISIRNTQPTATGGSLSTRSETPVEVDLRPWGDDADGDQTTYEIVTPPTHGSLPAILLRVTGRSTYHPEAGFDGTDSFTFRVSDGIEDSGVRTVWITVEPPVVSEIVMLDHSILDPAPDGDGDGIAEPGESVFPRVRLQHSGETSLLNVHVALAVDDPDVAVVSGLVTYATWAPGETRDGDGLLLAISPVSATHGVVAVATVTADNGGPWQFTIGFPISGRGGAADVDFEMRSEWIFDPAPGGNRDGVAEAGERVFPRVRLGHIGIEDAEDVVVTLTVSDPDVSVVGGTVAYPTWPAGDVRNNNGPAFVIAEDAAPHNVAVTVTVVSDRGGPWVFGYTIVVMESMTASANFVLRSAWIFEPNVATRNGVGDPGETILARFRLAQIGDETVEGVFVTFVTNDPDVIVKNGIQSIGMWVAGATQDVSFALDISPTATSHSVFVGIVVSTARGSWQFSLDIQITAGPPPSIVGVTYDPLELNALERSWMITLSYDGVHDVDVYSLAPVDSGTLEYLDAAGGDPRFVYTPDVRFVGRETMFASVDYGPGEAIGQTTITIDPILALYDLAAQTATPGEPLVVQVDFVNTCDGPFTFALGLHPAKGDVTFDVSTGKTFTYTARADATGGDQFSFHASTDGCTSNTVTVGITIAGGPVFEKRSCWLFDPAPANRDQQASRGERVLARVRLRNVGGEPAESVLVTVASDNADVVVTRGFVAHATWPAGAARTNTFVLHVRKSATLGEATLAISVTSANGPPLDEAFAFGIVPLPEFEQRSCWVFDPAPANRDLQANPGERILPRIRLKNGGQAAAHNVTVQISSSDGAVEIPHGVVQHATWPAGQARNNAGFVLRIAKDAAAHDVTLAVDVTADGGLEWHSSWTFPVVLLPPDMGRKAFWVFDPAPYGDKNGVANPGERVLPRIRLLNVGQRAAHNVRVVLNVTDGDVFVVNGELTHETWPAGEARNSDGLELSIGQNATPHGVTATVDVTADGGREWHFDWVFPIVSSSAGFTKRRDWIFDPAPGGNANGVAEPGERILPRVRLQNIGYEAAQDVDVTLSASDPDVYIHKGSVHHTTWPGREARNNNGFVLFIDSAASPHSVPVTVNVRAGDGSAWDFSFTMPIQTGQVTQAADMNADGTVDIADILVAATRYGRDPSLRPAADLNRDDRVDMADMVIVDAARDDRRPMAPAARLGADALVRRWLDEGRRSDDGSALFADGVAALERILRALLPRAAALWPNYPNPFNPETWIPFDLTEPASVTVTIYDVAGSLIREIRVGWTPAGTYRESRRAAHWDGRNTYGEQVASGVYVYELRAGAYRAARRMIVRK
ncbi:hypothetical protein HN371_14595 [Candidatus Poribacteria bacterium]|jgi:hypothetical protein|nr:hypothetical protein [Candidatus Poribacteria bacterium]MBT5712218.1 hypothetical protein [Candidatus Poribacteria bacterium]MBT7101534.1 hypothetical protein [Candidatus Poribacteria bacterium]